MALSQDPLCAYNYWQKTLGAKSLRITEQALSQPIAQVAIYYLLCHMVTDVDRQHLHRKPFWFSNSPLFLGGKTEAICRQMLLRDTGT